MKSLLRLISLIVLLSLFTVSVSWSSSAQGTSATVYIAPGQNIQALVDQHPAGTQYVLQSGMHRLQQIKPKDRDVFRGEMGAVLSGARLLTTFVQAGSHWYATDQTQEGRLHGTCAVDAPRCNRPEDLFVNNKRLIHVSDRSQLNADTWYFDYAADRIYIAVDPAGKTIETSVLPSAFYGSADRVTIRDLTIEKYATIAQHGAVHPSEDGIGWRVRNNLLHQNHGAGVYARSNMRIVKNRILDNGHIGISGRGTDIRVKKNEIAYNNAVGYHVGWEAGGAKFGRTDGLLLKGNYVHHNNGPGLWADVDSINIRYINNLVEWNSHTGIFHEISYKAVIKGNTIRFNASETAAWLYGAQILISSSRDVSVKKNKVVVSAAGGNGIGVIHQDRGSGDHGPRVAYNNRVKNNTIIHLGTVGRSGVAVDWNHAQFWREANNVFDKNKYVVPSESVRFWEWNDAQLLWDDLRSHEQELQGKRTVKQKQAGQVIWRYESKVGPHPSAAQNNTSLLALPSAPTE